MREVGAELPKTAKATSPNMNKVLGSFSVTAPEDGHGDL